MGGGRPLRGEHVISREGDWGLTRVGGRCDSLSGCGGSFGLLFCEKSQSGCETPGRDLGP